MEIDGGGNDTIEGRRGFPWEKNLILERIFYR
jgi:hypothetical protein